MKFALALLMLAMGAWAGPAPARPTIELIRQCRRPPMKQTTQTCMAAHKRWRWNDFTRSCDEMIYGGCMGTDNLFTSKEACQQKCQSMASIPMCPAEGLIARETGCELKKIMEPEIGCFENKLHCPNKPRQEPCPPLAQGVKPASDCTYREFKDKNGCDYGVIDCIEGPRNP